MPAFLDLAEGFFGLALVFAIGPVIESLWRFRIGSMAIARTREASQGGFFYDSKAISAPHTSNDRARLRARARNGGTVRAMDSAVSRGFRVGHAPPYKLLEIPGGIAARASSASCVVNPGERRHAQTALTRTGAASGRIVGTGGRARRAAVAGRKARHSARRRLGRRRAPGLRGPRRKRARRSSSAGRRKPG